MISWCFGCVSWWGEKSLITGKWKGRVAMRREKRERGNKKRNEKKEVLVLILNKIMDVIWYHI